MRRWTRTAAIAVTLALTATGCSNNGGGGGTSTGAIKEGGILRLGSASTIDSLNPFRAFQQDAYNSFMYIYPFLVQFDQNLNVIGDFASSWDVSPDHTTWTFHTVSGGTWSDGKPLTARDVAYTLNLILKYPGPTGLEAGYARHIASATATDDNTVVITYEAPVNEHWALSQLELIPILPQQVWSQHEGNEGHDLRTFTNDAPIVSGGPFVLSQYVKRDIAQFTANPGFYGPKPHIDGFGLKFYTNTDAMISALQHGELDAVENPLPAQALATLKSNPNIVIGETTGVYENDFIFNSNQPLHPELLDPMVRTAFAHAFDLNQMLNVVTLGHGQVAATFIPPVTGDWSNPNLQPEAYSIDQANQILDDLGYKPGSDGIRVANGHPMEYQVITPDSVTGIDREFQIVQQGLAQIGVKVTQKSLDPTATFAEIAGKGYVSYDSFDMAMWEWFPYIDPDFMLSVLTKGQWGFWSDSGYHNPTYDKLYDKQGLIVNPDARKKVVWQMQQMVFDDKPYVMLMNRNVLEAHTASWAGFVISPLGSFNNFSKATMLSVHQVG